MKKLAALGAGSVALAAMGFICAGQASSDDGTLDVSGQTYAQAVKILKAMGYRASFGGSVGGDVPQAQCIVDSQKVVARYRVKLMLDCTDAAQPEPGENQIAGRPVPGQPPGPPVVGSNGVTTVTPTPVGPQPGMSIPGT